MNIEIFTIAHNSMPFITRHLAEFEKLKLPWRWHIREGPAAFVADSYRNGGRLDLKCPDGRSSDGTAEYLDSVMCRPNLDIRRRHLWNGKTEMVNDAIAGIYQDSLIIEVDCDEMWTADQITHMADLFQKHPSKMAAWFYCRYFVGPDLMTTGINCLGNHTEYEWVRAWRYSHGCHFTRHEPPVMASPWHPDVAKAYFFTHEETKAEGLVFNHYSWVTEEQVRFKESYYGYAGTLDGWRRLQKCSTFPAQINDYIPCLGHGQIVRAPAEHCFKSQPAPQSDKVSA